MMPLDFGFASHTYIIFLMDTSIGRMSVQPILPIKVSVTIDTIHGNFDGHGDTTRKQTIKDILY